MNISWCLASLEFLSIMDLDVNSPTRFGNFSVIISLNKLPTIFTFPVPSVAFKMPILCHLMVSHKSYRHSLLLSVLFFFFFWISNYLSSSSIILFSSWSSLLLKTSIEFFITAIVFFSPKSFCLVLFLQFSFLCWTSHFVHVLFSWFPFIVHLLLWLKDSLIQLFRIAIDLCSFEIHHWISLFFWWCYVSLILHIPWIFALPSLYLKKQSSLPVFTDWLQKWKISPVSPAKDFGSLSGLSYGCTHLCILVTSWGEAFS